MSKPTFNKPGFCDNCPINKYTEGYVAPQEVEGSDKLIIGEAAGETEVRFGRPFAGLSGNYLNVMLKNAGEPREQWNVVNVLGCRPKDAKGNNTFPLGNQWPHTDQATARKAVEHCAKHHLAPFLTKKKWSKVLALGEQALRAATGKAGITYWRGSPLKFQWGLSEKPSVIPTYHPSFVGRSTEYTPIVIQDIGRTTELPKNSYRFNPSLEELKDWNPKVFAFDLEWDRNDNITVCGISDGYYQATVFSWKEEYVDFLKNLFENATDLIGWNIISADLPYFEKLGWNIKAKLHDTMLKQHLIQPDFPHTLAFASSVFTKAPFWKGRGKGEDDDEAADISGAPQYKTWNKDWAIPIEYGGYGGCKSEEDAYLLYNAYDTARSFEIEFPINTELEANDLAHVYWNLVVPVAKICKDITSTGWKLDTTRLDDIIKNLDEKIQELDAALPEGLRSFKQEKNINVPAPPGTYKEKTKKCRKCKKILTFTKPDQVITCCEREVPSGPMKEVKIIKQKSYEIVRPWASSEKVKAYARSKQLKIRKNYKTDRETADKYTRAHWATSHSEFRILNELVEFNTLRTNFAKDSLRDKHEVLFKILVHGTAEGRVSSSGKRRGIDLNIQNQPKQFRSVYIPSQPGHGTLDSDWASGENTLTAWFAQDWDLLDRIQNDPDFDEHTETAKWLFNVKEVDKGLRKQGKIVNHGMNYGMGYRKLLEEFHKNQIFEYTYTDTKEFIEIWRQKKEKIYQWQQRVVTAASRDGYLKNPFGRKRWLNMRDWHSKALAFLPASTLADMMLRCMVALYPSIYPSEIRNLGLNVARELPSGWYLRAQIHDSMVTIGPDEFKDEAMDVVGAVMGQKWPELNDLAIHVEHSYSGKGGSWGDCK